MDAEAESTEKTTTKRKAPKTAFRKGNKANPYGVKGKPEPPMPEGLATREETQLEAMRCVLTNEKPETVQQWRMSRWYVTDQKAFLAAKASLESAELRQAKGPVTPSGSSSGNPLPSSGAESSGGSGAKSLPVEDLGTDRVLELAGELIARLAEGA